MDTYLSLFVFFKQKTAYEMRISDWSSDVCSSDLEVDLRIRPDPAVVDLQAEADSIDMAIRFGQDGFPGLAATPFMHETVFAVASPELLAKGQPLRRPRDLCHHTLLHSDSVHLAVNSLGRWAVWLALLHVPGGNANAGPTYPS